MFTCNFLFLCERNVTKEFKKKFTEQNILTLILTFFISESPEKSPRKSPKVTIPPQQQKSHVKSEVSKEHREVSNEIATFLHKKLEKQAVKDVSIHVKKMVDKIQRFPLQNPENIEDLSVVLQDFYNLFQQRLQVHQLYKGIFTSNQCISLLDNAPNYLVGCVIQKRMLLRSVLIHCLNVLLNIFGFKGMAMKMIYWSSSTLWKK